MKVHKTTVVAPPSQQPWSHLAPVFAHGSTTARGIGEDEQTHRKKMLVMRLV
jgi:hypothetical protein